MTHTPRRYERTARVNEVVREVLADELERLSDPRLGFVTVTGVEVTPDLRQATVYYSVLGPGEARQDTADGLRSARAHLQAVLGKQVRMKYTPSLIFREDPAMSQGERVEQIIRTLHTDEADPGPGPAEDGDAR